jgi:anhydro-N-acetylmuramic acid kinase
MPSTLYKAIGLMSGTSCDGIDVALIETDGASIVKPLAFLGVDYSDEQKQQIRACYGMKEDNDRGQVAEMEAMLTRAHAEAIDKLLHSVDIKAHDIDVIGFHGQTLFHDPDKKFTWQIGDGALLARLTGIDVVNDFRSDDVASGGQGAPLAPVYHQAITGTLNKPIMVLNIGGVANVTYIGPDETLIAFDTGPGNALMDDWMYRHTGKSFDKDGHIAQKGRVKGSVLARLLNHRYFKQAAPKSLDRDAFSLKPLLDANLSLEDGMATLAAFTIESITMALKNVPERPRIWLVAGGGRKNPVLMQGLKDRLHAQIQPIDVLKLDGDAIEAQAFAVMAVRRLHEWPISFPGTTGCPNPMTGGNIHRRHKLS